MGLIPYLLSFLTPDPITINAVCSLWSESW
jgi:hypothetical protein